ncbi:MAG: DUF362 domain-containing protein [Labilithrix sp.]|nr:DUF362 domain-containing protein [Labilithrix sp.]
MSSDARRRRRLLSRRKALAAGAALGLGAFAYGLRHRLTSRLASLTQLASFTATPPLVPHDPTRDRTRICVAEGGTPGENVDAVLAKVGGVAALVGTDDVVIVKISAQWWNQGMTNVAAVKRLVERVLERPGFAGEVIVFENTHFRLADGSGLARAFTHPSERNVDVPGWNKLGDLVAHFRERDAAVSFVGLVDAGPSELSGDDWHDRGHAHGTYGGDGRGPIAAGDARDGYHWDFERAFRLARSWVDEARTPLTWPRFTSPRTGLVVDLKDGVMRRTDAGLVPAGRKLVWINMTTANEHTATGITGACKSTMGVVDMSAGALGTHPLARGYASVHYFGRGNPTASWRMAGPLAHFAREVRAPDLILLVAEWIAYEPAGFDAEREDTRHSAASCVNTKTIVAGTDPVAIDAWAVRHLMTRAPSVNKETDLDLDDPDSKVSKFLRYYRQVYGKGTLDPALVEVA